MVGYGGTDAWCSSKDISEQLADFCAGPVHVDPCSNPNSVIRARRSYDRGGLHIRWMKQAYENPPYSCADLWTTKGLDEIYDGNLQELIRLVMYRPSTAWWREMAGVPEGDGEYQAQMLRRKRWAYGSKRCRAPNPLIIATRRQKFIGDEASTAMFDTALIYYGKREARFLKSFKREVRWVARGRL